MGHCLYPDRAQLCIGLHAAVFIATQKKTVRLREVERLGQSHQVSAGPQSQVTLTLKHLTTIPMTAHDPNHQPHLQLLVHSRPQMLGSSWSVCCRPNARDAGCKPRVWAHVAPPHSPHCPPALAVPSPCPSCPWTSSHARAEAPGPCWGGHRVKVFSVSEPLQRRILPHFSNGKTESWGAGRR